MTTHGFDARPSDTIFAQVAMMDRGLLPFQLDVDYVKVDIVDSATAPPDLGEGPPYHQKFRPPNRFNTPGWLLRDAVIERRELDANLRDRSVIEEKEKAAPVLTVDGTLFIVPRLDLNRYAGKKANGSRDARNENVFGPAPV